jgi:hypothetical protein
MQKVILCIVAMRRGEAMKLCIHTCSSLQLVESTESPRYTKKREEGKYTFLQRMFWVVQILVLLYGGNTYGQGRAFGARTLILDDNRKNFLTINVPISQNWNGRQLILPVPPVTPTEMGFVNRGPSGPQPWGQMSYWYQDQWMPTNAIRVYDKNADGKQDVVFEGDVIGGTATFAFLSGSETGIVLADSAGMLSKANSLPQMMAVPFTQITTGANTSATMSVNGSASLIPQGNGTIAANMLVGSGNNKYSGSVNIPENTLTVSIPYSGVTSTSTVLVTINDPSGQTAHASVENIAPGIGFTVSFSGFYPTTTGKLNYLVVN